MLSHFGLILSDQISEGKTSPELDTNATFIYDWKSLNIFWNSMMKWF